jgi:hypothetical protein
MLLSGDRMNHVKSMIAAGAIVLLACTSTNDGGSGASGGGGPSPPLGGDTSIALGSVGNVFSNIGGINVGGDTVLADVAMTVVKNEGGVATLKLKADLSKDPRLAKLDKLIPSSMKDASGKIDADLKLRITSEGVQDYLNRDSAQHTLVSYGSSVGDTYKLTKSNGATITRTVVAKSDQDDFPYGFMLIKTMTVEQDSRIPGVKKFVIRANHKFGIVYLAMVAEDGTTIGTTIVSKN